MTPEDLEKFPQLRGVNIREYIQHAAARVGTELTFDEDER